MKTCSRCEISKEESEFYKDSSASDGLTASCKECQKEYQRKRYQENKEEIYDYTSVKEKDHVCVQCGDSFKSTHNPKYCSKKCKRRAKYERKSKHTITCINCGEQAEVTQRDGKYCSTECFYEHTNYDHFKEVYEYELECVSCGGGFTAKSNRAKYCSDGCNPNTWDKTRIYFKKCRACHEIFVATRANTKTCSDECTTKYRRLYIKLISVRDHYANQRDNPETCTNCGDEFIRKYGEKSKMCSDKCKEEYHRKMRSKVKYRRKMLKRGASVSQNIDPMKVLKRDKHRCQMCGCKTPKRLRGTIKDNAPEIDHIVPLSEGGNHSYNNVQTLCRSCNQSKSNNYVGQQPLQFGEPEGISTPTGVGH